MKVLIIGGAGYIGSHVAREFLDHGHLVTVFDNLSSGLEKNSSPRPASSGGISWSRFPARSHEGGYDALVHLAAFKAAGVRCWCPRSTR
jgi:UDP-glucose 4-epimerase